MEPEEVQHLRSGQRKRCWGGCSQGEGAPGASSGDKRVDFQEEGMIDQMQFHPLSLYCVHWPMGRSLPALGEDDEKQYKMSVKSQNLRIKYTWVCIPSFFFFFPLLAVWSWAGN